MNDITLEVIAHIHTDFPAKFGIPRQSGLADTRATVLFVPKYRNPDALRGLEEFSHLWLLWGFSGNIRQEWSPTVRPPRLGGNKRVGVFASRSPFRPNPIGLSCVALEGMESREGKGTLLHVRGADLMDGTPIYDIKPYLPYVDCHPDAREGFAGEVKDYCLEVVFPEKLLEMFPEAKRQALVQVLRQDPRPSYHEDPERRYGVAFSGYDVHFRVKDGVLTVSDVTEYKGPVQPGGSHGEESSALSNG